jgi:hypothetical protein
MMSWNFDLDIDASHIPPSVPQRSHTANEKNEYRTATNVNFPPEHERITPDDWIMSTWLPPEPVYCDELDITQHALPGMVISLPSLPFPSLYFGWICASLVDLIPICNFVIAGRMHHFILIRVAFTSELFYYDWCVIYYRFRRLRDFRTALFTLHDELSLVVLFRQLSRYLPYASLARLPRFHIIMIIKIIGTSEFRSYHWYNCHWKTTSSVMHDDILIQHYLA